MVFFPSIARSSSDGKKAFKIAVNNSIFVEIKCGKKCNNIIIYIYMKGREEKKKK